MVVMVAVFLAVVIFSVLGILSDCLPEQYKIDGILAMAVGVSIAGFVACMGWLG